MPSGVSTGTISAPNAPLSIAAAALAWLASAYASICSRLKPYLSAIAWAPWNWLKSATP